MKVLAIGLTLTVVASACGGGSGPATSNTSLGSAQAPTTATVVHAAAPTTTRVPTTIGADLDAPLNTPRGAKAGPTETPSGTASAVTGPPADMTGINSMHDLLRTQDGTVAFGTQANPAMVTLGPTDGGEPSWPAYESKHSLNFKMPKETPILAPLDMRFVGFKNRSAEYRQDNADSDRMEPFDDLELCFESNSADWPGLIMCVYHLYTTPLLQAHLDSDACGIQERWDGGGAEAGRIYYEYNSTEASRRDPESCRPLLGSIIARGGVIGYSGQVGDNPHSAFKFKAPSANENRLTTDGDPYLHWVQPSVFFYWQCFDADAEFQPGVLAYPFDCDDVHTADPAVSSVSPESGSQPLEGLPGSVPDRRHGSRVHQIWPQVWSQHAPGIASWEYKVNCTDNELPETDCFLHDLTSVVVTAPSGDTTELERDFNVNEYSGEVTRRWVRYGPPDGALPERGDYLFSYMRDGDVVYEQTAPFDAGTISYPTDVQWQRSGSDLLVSWKPPPEVTADMWYKALIWQDGDTPAVSISKELDWNADSGMLEDVPLLEGGTYSLNIAVFFNDGYAYSEYVIFEWSGSAG